MVQQRPQVPARARRGTPQKLRTAQRGTGKRVTDRRIEQLQPPAQRGHGGTAQSCAGIRPAAGSSCGRPNEATRPWSAKATIRAIPFSVTVSTCTACA